MFVLFRTEAGKKIGFGHLIRSLSVAKKIREFDPGIKIVFLIPENDAAHRKLSESNFEHCLANDKNEEGIITACVNMFHPDVIFIDKLFNYTPDFIKTLTQNTKVVMLHNYCEGAYFCDSYIFPGAHTDPALIEDERWQTSYTKVFLGFDYVIISEEILKGKRISGNSGHTRKVVITMGGSDPMGLMLILIQWLNEENLENVELWALIGEAASYKERLNEMSDNLSPHIHVLDYHPDVYCNADFAISSFGQSTYELLFLGIPVLSIGHIRQNALGSHILSKKTDLLTDLGCISDLSKETFLTAWRKALNIIKTNSDIRPLIDGRGAERIADIIIKTGKGVM